MRRTISGMVGKGSLTHNNRNFIAENIDHARTGDNITYCHEDLKQVYQELFGAALERYVRVLTGNCTQDQFPEIASSARKKLYAVRRELDKLPAKLRCMALGALYARPLYRMVRKAYDTATGAAHKYDVE